MEMQEADLATRIRMAMAKAQVTDVQVAERLGVSAATVARWRKSETVPNVAQVLVIAEICGVSDGFLIRGSSDAAREEAA